MGFQKRKKFASQQEYRYIFSLKHLRDTVDNLDFIQNQGYALLFYAQDNRPMIISILQTIDQFKRAIET